MNSLKAVKLVHTAIWAFLATCVLAIAPLAWAQMYGYAFILTGIVLLEVLVLSMNGWRCPLTDIAVRYTDDRSDNFDIYLPRWVAKNNKHIFGALFVVSEISVVILWLSRLD